MGVVMVFLFGSVLHLLMIYGFAGSLLYTLRLTDME